ncbi:MAG: hypothetical protein EPN36_13955 [Rhodanobacteraceae bacterium]|nr:MAG: hypothetical protein EPN36_13955 [Rhodanobacteraceae bacterium]
MRGLKSTNCYQQALAEALYRECPKAVLAAIAVSALTQGGDFVDEADQRLVTEWDVLHGNGIVPQPVPGKWRSKINHERGL